MIGLIRGQRLVVATHNPGKVREIADLLRPFDIDAVSAGALGLAEPEETEATFAGNARLKAVAAATAAQLPALADDSGLAVDLLDGAPGVLSARWAGPGKDFVIAMQRVRAELLQCGGWRASGADGDPRAHFCCALALAMPDATAQIFEGVVHGRLVWPPRGTRGFGYDPMFVADGQFQTFAEMAPERKHAISHRARAFKLLVDACVASGQS
jgi:XTP/dITP diphosphohydrolase